MPAGAPGGRRKVEARGEPIVNPITGQAHRARINLPDGFEFTVAEAGRGWGKSFGAIEHNLADSHAHFANLHIGHKRRDPLTLHG